MKFLVCDILKALLLMQLFYIMSCSEDVHRFKIVKSNVNSLEKDGCTPHLIYFKRSYNALGNIAAMIEYPVHVTNAITACDSGPMNTECAELSGLKNSRFIKPISYRHSLYKGEICHVFMLLWPKKVNGILSYLTQFDRVLPAEDITTNANFPNSYLGTLYYIFFLESLHNQSLNKCNDNDGNYLDWSSTLLEKVLKRIPNQSFLYLSRANIKIGLTHLANENVACHALSNSQNFFSKLEMDTFLSLKSRVIQIQGLDDEAKIARRKIKAPLVDLRFGNLYKDKKFVLLSLIVSRMPNVTINMLLHPAKMLVNKKFITLIRFTSFTERVPEIMQVSLSQSSDMDFPNGLGRAKGSIIFRNREFFNFITCDGSKQLLTFEWTTSAFDSNVWIVGSIFFVMMAIILNVIFKAVGTSLALVIFTHLMEQSCYSKTKQSKKSAYRMVIGSLLLSTIMIATCYKGIFVKELTKPRRLEGLKSMKDLVDNNYTIYAPPKKLYSKFLHYGQVDFFGTHYIMRWPEKILDSVNFIEMPGVNETFKEALIRQKTLKYFVAFEYSEIILQLSSKGINDEHVNTGFKLTKSITIPKGYPHISFQKKIASCEKTAFIDRQSNLHRFYDPKYWKNIRPRKLLYHGFQDDMTTSKLLIVEVYGGFLKIVDFLSFELKRLVESGIYDQWEHILNNSPKSMLFKLFLLSEANNRVDRALSLQGSNIEGVFWIYSSFCSISLLVFLIEIVKHFISA